MRLIRDVYYYTSRLTYIVITIYLTRNYDLLTRIYVLSALSYPYLSYNLVDMSGFEVKWWIMVNIMEPGHDVYWIFMRYLVPYMDLDLTSRDMRNNWIFHDTYSIILRYALEILYFQYSQCFQLELSYIICKIPRATVNAEIPSVA